MRCVILAGGRGTRLAEETETRPKPMVEIGDRPMLWHIMRHYGVYQCHEFFVALGYRGDVIRRYFVDYATLAPTMSVDLGRGAVQPRLEAAPLPWQVHLVETGDTTNTGGRVHRLRAWLAGERFMLTYGDGVSDVNLDSLLRYHIDHGKLATVTAVRPPARFGALELEDDRVLRFSEKPQASEGWINGGYFVFEPGIFDYLSGDGDSLESDALERLAHDDQLRAFKHTGFWQCMDTLRDWRLLDQLWREQRAPWKIWA